VTVTATNLAGSTSKQVQVTVGKRPAITSPDHALFARGTAGSFTVTASGSPSPDLRLAGKLPTGLIFTAHPDGTATVAGTPTGRFGARVVTLTAVSPAGSDTQQLTLTVGLATGACANRIDGTAGDDLVRGSSAGDALLGHAGADVLVGRSARDCLRGGSGTDRLQGGRGGDTLVGGPDADLLFGGSGRDQVRAGAGDDVVHVRDGQVDTVHCGAGTDEVLADPQDVLVGCERVG
jgi:Ca2+-binding RTX toxin-like protein